MWADKNAQINRTLGVDSALECDPSDVSRTADLGVDNAYYSCTLEGSVSHFPCC